MKDKIYVYQHLCESTMIQVIKEVLEKDPRIQTFKESRSIMIIYVHVNFKNMD